VDDDQQQQQQPQQEELVVYQQVAWSSHLSNTPLPKASWHSPKDLADTA